MTTTENLTTMSPPEIDARFADIAGRRADAMRKLRWAYESLARDAGDKGRYVGRQHQYTISASEAVRTVTEQVAAGEHVYVNGHHASVADMTEHLARYDATRAVFPILAAEESPLMNEWHRRGGWSRFFIVPGGHIHRSMNCSTCNHARQTPGGYMTGGTEFGWLPELSGLAEAEAVAAHGALLCTVCYPSAPTEWTNGTKPVPEGRCPGSSQQGNDITWNRRSDGGYGTCPTCGQVIAVTVTGKVRIHKIPKEATR